MKQWVDFIESKTSEYPEDSVALVVCKDVDSFHDIASLLAQNNWMFKLTCRQAKKEGNARLQFVIPDKDGSIRKQIAGMVVVTAFILDGVTGKCMLEDVCLRMRQGRYNEPDTNIYRMFCDSVEIVSTMYLRNPQVVVAASSELEQIRNAFKKVTEDVWRMKLTKEKQRE